MKTLVASAAMLACSLLPLAAAADDDGLEDRSQHAITLAVFGDWPYSTVLLNSARLLIDSVNADPRVSLVIHVDVVIALQADMWDPAAVAPGGDGLGNYTLFVHELASLSLHFGRPVLLINGDSHVFGSDRPLADPGSATGKIHGAPAVPNLTRITVQGSTSAPAEWLRLTIDPHAPGVFSWENVVYCNNPTLSCP